MTVIEIKTELHRLVDDLPESALTDMLFYAKALANHPTENASLNKHLQKIFNEDKELLEKLAK